MSLVPSLATQRFLSDAKGEASCTFGSSKQDPSEVRILFPCAPITGQCKKVFAYFISEDFEFPVVGNLMSLNQEDECIAPYSQKARQAPVMTESS